MSSKPTAAPWVGVGGSGHGATWPFPQTGTDSNCVNGDQMNDYWCSYKTFKRFGVFQGDVVKAKIYETRGNWLCSVQDVTRRSSDLRALDYGYRGTTRTSEWIVESTTISLRGKTRIGKLADFGSLTFSDMSMTSNQWKSGNQNLQNNLFMTGVNGNVIAAPSWSTTGLTITYK